MVVIVALVIHVLINIDMFVKKDNIPAIRSYRVFAISIALFYLSDIIWGVFDEQKYALGSYITTVIYFVLMGFTILVWSDFVVRFLDGNRKFAASLKVIALMIFVSEVALLIVNAFYPILFDVDENAVYHAYLGRNIILYAQIVMYSLMVGYSFYYTFSRKVENFRRYIAVSLFSTVMITCIAIQLFYPLIPLYSTGCLIGTCILDTFALSDTKERFKSAYICSDNPIA